LANGFPDDLVEEFSHQVTFKEPLLLFRNEGNSFRNVSAESGPVFSKAFAARGLAVGDFDNDGGLDVLISNNDGPPILLRNNLGGRNHWLGVRLVGRRANVDAIGARVTYQARDLKRSRMKVGGGSFLSSHDPRLVLGMGNRTKVDWVEVKWPLPGGGLERFENLPVDRYVTLVEGSGKRI
jgi:enediyne biosynthesis protein E4